MEKIKKTVFHCGLGILGIVGGTAACVALKILSAWAFVLAAIACYPMAKVLWNVARYVRSDPVRILRRALPKIGYTIDETEWNEGHSAVRFYGKFREDNFMVQASHDSAFVFVYNMPWYAVEASDPIVPRMLEAINEVNGERSSMSVFMDEPNEDGVRQIYTVCQTLLPSMRPDAYLDTLMCDMLNRRAAFAKALDKERPYMNQRRSPIGFSVQTPEKPKECSKEDPIAPAAKCSDEVKI